MTFKIANNPADNALYLAWNCVKWIHLGRHSAVSHIWPFSREKYFE